jgi:hypothetical protein
MTFTLNRITIVTLLRLQAIPALNNTRNRPWSLAPLAYWSGIEMAAGLICACLPALRKVRYIFRGKEPSTYNYSSQTYASSASRSAASRRKTSSAPKLKLGAGVISTDYANELNPELGINNSKTELVELKSAIGSQK